MPYAGTDVSAYAQAQKNSSDFFISEPVLLQLLSVTPLLPVKRKQSRHPRHEVGVLPGGEPSRDSFHCRVRRLAVTARRPFRHEERATYSTFASLLQEKGIVGLVQARTGDALMDFDPCESHWRDAVPPLTLLETCWQMKSGDPSASSIFRAVAAREQPGHREGCRAGQMRLGLGRRAMHRYRAVPAAIELQPRGGIGVAVVIVAYLDPDGSPQEREFRPRRFAVQPREADDSVVRNDADASRVAA